MRPGYCYISDVTDRYLDKQSAIEMRIEAEDKAIEDMLEFDSIEEHVAKAPILTDMIELVQNCLIFGYDEKAWSKFDGELRNFLRPIVVKNLDEY